MANSQTVPTPNSLHPEHRLGSYSWAEAKEAVLHWLPPPAASPGQRLLLAAPRRPCACFFFIALDTLYFSSSESLYFTLKY